MTRAVAVAAFGLAALATLVGAPRTAPADPVVARLSAAPAGGSKLAVEIDAAFDTKGRVTLEASVAVDGKAGGRVIRLRKRVAAGSRTVRFVLDARRARVRRSGGPVSFTLTATAEQRGVAAATESISATLPVPLLVLPGFGNERTPGGFDTFTAALDAAAGGVYGVGGAHPSASVHEYDSTLPLGALGADLDRAARRALRGTVFSRVDVVGYSMGGLVARQWMAGRGKGRVRTLVFLGTPNLGAPIAYVAGYAASSGVLDEILAGVAGGALTGLGADFLDPDVVAALRTLYPTYDWAFITNPFGGGLIPVPSQLLPDSESSLEALNAVAPDPKAEIHAFYYTAVPTEAFGIELGTVDVVDVTSLLGGLAGGDGLDFSNVDVTTLATGSGDGIVPAHSVTMDEVPAWAARIAKHDLGEGTHVTFALDPAVFAGVAGVLGR